MSPVIEPVPPSLPASAMRQALQTGWARLLSPLNRDIARYRDRWWVADTDQWLRLDDAQLHERLEAAAARLDGIPEGGRSQ
jgi:hypothetical protein